MPDFVAVPDAHARIHADVQQVGTETVALIDAHGRTTAHAVTSPGPLPPFDNSAMDGYALRAADVPEAPTTLPLAFSVSIQAPERALPEGTCAQITTGQPLPPGSDAVIQIEHTTEDDGRVRLTHPVERGQNVRLAGENVKAGEEVVAAGRVLTPAAISLLASVGAADVVVRRTPQVAVLVTGDEIVPHTEVPPSGAIRDSNGPALQAMIRTAGGEARVVHARDDREHLRHVVETLQEADALVVSGGMSVGRDDIVREVLTKMGATWAFYKVKQRPGKPFSFGVWDGVPVFGLPGNPVSSAVCFEVYVRPALARMLGRQQIHRPRHVATLTEALRINTGLHYFARGVATTSAEGCLNVRSTGAQGSGISRSMWAANCLIHIQEERAHPHAGERVEIEWLS